MVVGFGFWVGVSPGGGQDSGGTKFVQQIVWENDKNGPKNAELEDREPGG